MFLNDYDIHTFVNHEHDNIVRYFWIIVNSDKHFKEIDFLCKHYRNIYLIIKIKNFEQYDVLLKELSKYSFIVLPKIFGVINIPIVPGPQCAQTFIGIIPLTT